MISITVVFIGLFARMTGRRELEIQLPEEAAVADALSAVTPLFDSGHRSFSHVQFVTCNGRKVESSTLLDEGDRLVFMVPLVGGG